MYYRRKILLALLESVGGVAGKTKFQKLLLILTRLQEKKVYDFVPYIFGCYSFTANNDLRILANYGYIAEKIGEDRTKHCWQIITNTSYMSQLSSEDRMRISHVVKQFGDYSTDALIRYTYTKYPFWAINSSIAKDLLSQDELNTIERQKRSSSSSQLFTIGYEGISLETYINRLILNDVQLLCDVRKNPLSKKFGFSKSQLKSSCEKVGIRYIHIPQLGIISDKRQELNSLNDYIRLFDDYEKTTLKENISHLYYIQTLIKQYSRVALTCFEASHCMCHRGRVSEALQQLPGWSVPVKNL